MNNDSIFWIVYLSAIAIIYVANLIYNWKHVNTVGELVTPFSLVDAPFNVILGLVSIIPVVNVAFIISSTIVVIGFFICEYIHNTKAMKWFIKNIWNHKIRETKYEKI